MRKTRIFIEEGKLICQQSRFTKRCRPIKEITELTVDRCPTHDFLRPRGTSTIQVSVMFALILIVGLFLLRSGVSFGAVLLLLFGIVAFNMLFALILHYQPRLKRGIPADAVACITVRFRDKSTFEGYITEEDTVQKIEQKM